MKTILARPAGRGKRTPAVPVPDARARCLAGLAAGALAWALLVLLDASHVGEVFRDPDDALRLVMVRDWLGGQAWGDVWQHRMQAGGTPMHWTRVDDLPMAAVVVALRGWLGQAAAERAAMLCWPGALIPLVGAVAAVAAGRSWTAAWLSVGGVMTEMVLDRFSPGRIDHHALMSTCAFAACATLLLPPRARTGALAGAATALCLAVGFEDLGVLAVLGCCAAALHVVRPGAERGYVTAYGLALAGCSGLAWAALVPDGARTATACDALSGAWVAAICGAGLALATLALAPPGRTVRARLARLVPVAAVPALAMVVGGRACAAGPFAGLPPSLRADWLDRVQEMGDVLTQSHGDPQRLLAMVGVPVLAAGLCWFAWERGRRPSPREACYLAVTVLAIAFGARYVRNAGLANLMAAPVAARCLAGAFAARHLGPRWRKALAFALLVPMGAYAKDVTAGRAGVPGDQERACYAASAWKGVATLGPGMAATPVDLAPAVLLYTDMRVVGGGYHRAPQGLGDLLAFTNGRVEADVRRVLARDQVDYVVWCAELLEVTKAGEWHPGSFAARLAAGDLPAWLVPVDVGPGAVRVARVAPDPDPDR